MKEPITSRDLLSIGLSILFPTLITIFGALVGLILIAFILGALTGAWVMRKRDSAAH
jgi:hypothetical protein